ncbi:hypothetical protein CCZ01_05800 [Helicobacter monodelphidis]|uniref:flagellar export protein FliJ n=1 Tax=Helicobacter sp. 15-1451 TaxID=2004995 RepID=UPI000DCD8A72|nr:flagellar export protein FliJ [Helicobacter sp. 15-1451]RAX57496.1 hypothetical protein CCZ01_05800 [Helicobacter sp. 15-1451]
MKTKFTPLVRLRESAMKEGERKLIAINQKIAATQSHLDSVQQEFVMISMPKTGESYLELLQVQSIKDGYLAEIDRIVETLGAFKLEKKVAQEELRLLNLEFEKASHLDSLEKAKILEARKRKEAQELDEISVMLYNTRLAEGGQS